MPGRDRIRIGWPFRKLGKHPLLEPLLASLPQVDGPLHVGWGMRPSGLAAMRKAGARNEKRLILEDAFVRSIRPGNEGAVYGLLTDSKGMHFASGGESDLIEALGTGRPCGWMRQALFPGEDAGEIMQRFRQIGASKYNWFPGGFAEKAPDFEPGILVVDQTRGDASLRHGGVGDADFERMILSAFEESAGTPVYLRGHPDHLLRSKTSCFPRHLLADKRIRFLPPDLPPAACFPFCRTVMTAGSLLGMEALVHGCRVVTFGNPFYAGWGLTEDRAATRVDRKGEALDRKGAMPDLNRLFEFAYLRYCHYFHPDTREPCGLGQILDHLELQQRMFRENRGRSVTVGLTPWARHIADSYLRSPAGSVTHVSSWEEARESHDADRFLVWSRKLYPPPEFAARTSRVEDGFIRSRGLGASFNFPYSWVIDPTGIYFDASAPSRLEELLENGFSPAELGNVRDLIDLLREKRLTKYNLAARPIGLDPSIVRGRRVLLVPGQVEADASIAFGSPEIRSNLALLRRVRELEPEACIVFKAHPDLVAGARHGKVLPPGYAEACDLAVTDGNVLDWLELCDEVHTMTSTVGFEALIRGVPVVTYGMPFYAGWGLTRDRLDCPRRRRRLSVEELVCGALLHYPRYLNPETGEFTTALRAAQVLTSPAAAVDRRAAHLRCLSALKKLWVSLRR